MIKQNFWRRPAVLAISIALGLGGFAIAGADRVLSSNPPLSMKFAKAIEAPSRTGFALIVKEVLPAVVTISSSKVVKTPAGGGQFPMDDPVFRQFFGGDFGQQFSAPRQQREHGLGSGVIVSPNGYILTNNHVVDGATDVTVTLSDKRDFKAKVIGSDAKTDIAVLRVDAAGLPSIVIGDSSKVQVGDYALAVGNPFGVGKTVTMGIVSAMGRTNLGIEDYEDFIQTDAPINPGNSGGALVNDRGELIGINTAILANGSEGNQGIGFAIPVNLARTVMNEIIGSGKVTRAYLGILPQDVTPAIQKAFGATTSSGALVGDVTPNSPAAKSGIERGDIIVQLDGKAVTDANDLRMRISMMHPDTVVRLAILRGGAQREVAATLAELPTERASSKTGDDASQSAIAGVSVENLDSDSAQQLGLPPNSTGVVVTAISPSSPAADSGLQRGDVIQEVNRQPVKTTSDFERAIRASKDNPVLLVNRKGSTMYLAA
jgi:serine protease Do